jgi:hypothetical protein
VVGLINCDIKSKQKFARFVSVFDLQRFACLELTKSMILCRSLDVSQNKPRTLPVSHRPSSCRLSVYLRAASNAVTKHMARYANVEYADVQFVLGFFNDNALAAAREYELWYLERRQPDRRVFQTAHRTSR